MTPSFTPVVAAAERGGEWELPPMEDLFVFPPIPGTESWGVFAINRTSLILLFSAVVIAAFFYVAFGSSQIVPGRLQAAAEAFVEFIRKMAVEVIGPEGTRFVPLLATLFAFIFLNNLFKIVPFIMLPPTSRLHIPLFLALIVWLVYVGVGLKEQGLGYLKDMAFPPGVPWMLYPILTPIELASNLVIRPLTLTLRLFANMVAGHILVVITLITIHVFFVIGPELGISIFALAISPVVFGFELFVISLQAYIFTILAAVYISSSMHPH